MTARVASIILASHLAIAANGGEPALSLAGATFVNEGTASPLEDGKRMLGVTNTTEFIEKMSGIIRGVQQEVSDPFVAERLPFVVLESTQSGGRIAGEIRDQLLARGWVEGRDILAMERTNCGGDWARVFSHGEVQILVHVCGPMMLESFGSMDEADNSFNRTITLRLRGISPEQLLGAEFRNGMKP